MTITQELAEPEASRALLGLLDAVSVPYRLIDHEPQGRTDLASELRGHALSAAAKCMVVALRYRDRTDHVVAVVPGDTRVDLKAVRRLYGANDARLAPADVAQDLSGCVIGTIMPFSFDPRLGVVADPRLLDEEHIYFNLARLDRSVELRARDYAATAAPRFAPIAKDQP
ncbi:MAG TPA: YbaK/EbsC family protein [Actinospica sp.]|nr:YbaK/EbsC family protein [Actinospica sp.]